MNRQYIDYQQIKRVPLEIILRRLGVKESPRNTATAKDAWFFSPFRQETSPSFHVLREVNCWTDFGDGTKGTNIDLIIRLSLASDSYSAARWIESHFLIGDVNFAITPPTLVAAQSDMRKEPGAKLIRAREITSHKLIAYFERVRCIPQSILSSYGLEVHYRIANGAERYGAGIINVNGGFAVRNPFGKITVGKAGVSLFKGVNNSCITFEGMTNMLSYVVLHGMPSADMIVLNSVGNLPDAIRMMGDYSSIHCFLDNDSAGKKATDDIIQAFGHNAIDCSEMYARFNDINDYLIHIRTHT